MAPIPCRWALLTAEIKARAAKLGLWNDPDYDTKAADNSVAAILASRGRFAIVEGKVLSVRESGGTVYVNFGRRWSEDFTVTILKRIGAKFVAAGSIQSGSKVAGSGYGDLLKNGVVRGSRRRRRSSLKSPIAGGAIQARRGRHQTTQMRSAGVE